MSLGIFACNKKGNENSSEENIVMPEIYEKVFDGEIIQSEPVTLIDDGTEIASSLMYNPEQIIKVTDYRGITLFDESDYEVVGKKIIRKQNSRMPYLAKELLCDNTSKLQTLIHSEPWDKYNFDLHEAKEAGKSIIFTEGVGILMNQIQVTYKTKDKWQGYQQENYSETALSNFVQKLERGEEVTVVFYGASTMTGANTSGKLGVEPYLKTFPELVIDGLLKKYPNATINYQNPSIGGKLTDWAVANVENSCNLYHPDLVFTMWGMNDGSWRIDEQTFTDRCETLIKSIQANTDADILFASSMLANALSPQNTGFVEKYHPYIENYVDDYGIGLVDVTEFSKDLYKLKSSVELLNNNINHPNDFYARCLADLILRAIIK